MDQVGNFGAAGVIHGKVIRAVSAPLNEVLTTYRTLNVLRSAISSNHPKLDGYLVGHHPYVIQLLKVALQTRPPKPRYTHAWDVDLVTNYILSLGRNRSLKLKDLSLKLGL